MKKLVLTVIILTFIFSLCGCSILFFKEEVELKEKFKEQFGDSLIIDGRINHRFEDIIAHSSAYPQLFFGIDTEDGDERLFSDYITKRVSYTISEKISSIVDTVYPNSYIYSIPVIQDLWGIDNPDIDYEHIVEAVKNGTTNDSYVIRLLLNTESQENIEEIVTKIVTELEWMRYGTLTVYTCTPDKITELKDSMLKNHYDQMYWEADQIIDDYMYKRFKFEYGEIVEEFS